MNLTTKLKFLKTVAHSLKPDKTLEILRFRTGAIYIEAYSTAGHDKGNEFSDHKMTISEKSEPAE